MAKLIAISGGKKVEIVSNASHGSVAKLRRDLMQADEHFDMFGLPTCKFRIKK